MNWEIIDENAGGANIKVIGVGGAGGNAVVHMMNHNIQGADFICANTDAQALDRAKGSTILKLGENFTRGLGAGADPAVGRAAAERDRTAIEELLYGADMIFITAGMGGGTGTGAAPVIAQVAKELGALTVAVVTKPLCASLLNVTTLLKVEPLPGKEADNSAPLNTIIPWSG